MIGCGAVTEIKSGPAFAHANGSVLAAVASRSSAAATAYAKRHHVPLVFENVDDLISSAEVDVVYIATPPRSHKELALRVARARKPCCVEKPMALNYAECVAMLEAFAAHDVPLFVSYYRRSLPRFRKVKQWLEQKRIGQVREIHWHLVKPPASLARGYDWRTDPAELPGGYFSDLASHGIDLFQFLLGDITEARGIATNQQGLYRAEDAVSACWKFASGAIGSGSWVFGGDRREDEVQIIGAHGKIIFSVFDEAPLRLLVADRETAIFVDNPHHIQLPHVENMLAHLRAQSRHPALGIEAAKTNRIMAEILGTQIIT